MTEEIKSDPRFKGAVKEAIQEWLNEQFASFGRWTFYGLCSLALAGLVYLALVKLGLSIK